MPTLPMLSSEGWVTDPNTLMTRLFSHMFLTDEAQSNNYLGVLSLQYITLTYGDNIGLFIEKATTAIRSYYERYFDSAEVEINLYEDEGSKQSYTIMINAVKDGQRVDLSTRLNVDNSTITANLLTELE